MCNFLIVNSANMCFIPIILCCFSFHFFEMQPHMAVPFYYLQAVTKAKLGYDPLEVNPEDMVRFAKERPQVESLYIVLGNF